MSKKIIALVVGCVLVALLPLVSCKTPPKKTDPAPEPVAVVEPLPTVAPAVRPVDDALVALRDRAAALHEEGLKFALNTAKPDEWGMASAARDAGLLAFDNDYDAAEKAFKDAIARYEAMRGTSLDTMLAELDAALSRAREAAIKVGASEYAPDRFILADGAADEYRSLRASGKQTEAYDAGQIALLRYNTLEKALLAIAAKNTIDAHSFASAAADEYAQAGVRLGEAEAAYAKADAAAYDAASASLFLYLKVKNAGFRDECMDLGPKIEEIKAQSDSIKARRSTEKDYDAALGQYLAGSEAGKKDDWETAYDSYMVALSSFTAVYQEVSLKRNAADLAISQAKAKQATSTELALRADVIAPLPADASGFQEDTGAAGEEIK